MTGSLPPNLILSLIFGAGQMVVGGWLAAYSLARGRYRQWRLGLMAFVGLWFVVSGVIELFVSGMESSQRLTGAPDAVVFVLWKARADSALFIASAMLVVGAVIYPLALRWLPPSQRVAAPGERAYGAPDARTETRLEGKRGR